MWRMIFAMQIKGGSELFRPIEREPQALIDEVQLQQMKENIYKSGAQNSSAHSLLINLLILR